MNDGVLYADAEFYNTGRNEHMNEEQYEVAHSIKAGKKNVIISTFTDKLLILFSLIDRSDAGGDCLPTPEIGKAHENIKGHILSLGCTVAGDS